MFFRSITTIHQTNYVKILTSYNLLFAFFVLLCRFTAKTELFMLRLDYLKKVTHEQVYFWSLISIAISLPTSKALMSIAPFIALINWVWEGNLKQKFRLFFKNPAIWLLPAIFAVYLVGLLWTGSMKWGLHDVKIQIPLLIVPLVIGTSKALDFKKIKLILIAFSGAVLFASFCSLYVWLGLSDLVIQDNRDISLFISHIRFSLLVNFAIFSLSWYVVNSKLNTPKIEKTISIAAIGWLILFLFILKSMTGIVVFILVSAIVVIYLAFKVKHVVVRFAIFVFVLMLPVAFGAYLTKNINEFYKIEDVSKEELEQKTKQGNLYHHNFDDKQLENGHYVFLFICEEELREAWNNRSKINYDTYEDPGFNKYALFRYLTSKGLRKDAEGLAKLTDEDIHRIEHGKTNYRFTNRLSIDGRIYQTIWEFDRYKKGANPAGSSVVQRWEYFKIACQVIKENFWFGTGTGGYYPAYEKKYDEHPFFNDSKFRQRSHNMFLSYWVDFGIIGLLFICFAYVYPIFRQKKQKSYLLLTMLLIVFLSCLNEDTLNNHDAIVFFTFFYSLFLFSKYERKNNAIVE